MYVEKRVLLVDVVVVAVMMMVWIGVWVVGTNYAVAD
jgi:hypothetical protein